MYTLTHLYEEKLRVRFQLTERDELSFGTLIFDLENPSTSSESFALALSPPVLRELERVLRTRPLFKSEMPRKGD